MPSISSRLKWLKCPPALRSLRPLRAFCTIIVLCTLNAFRILHTLLTLHALVYARPRALRVFNLDLFYRGRIQLHKQYSQQPNHMSKLQMLL